MQMRFKDLTPVNNNFVCVFLGRLFTFVLLLFLCSILVFTD